jgi:membrane-bound lytic murein transglycosylase B
VNWLSEIGIEKGDKMGRFLKISAVLILAVASFAEAQTLRPMENNTKWLKKEMLSMGLPRKFVSDAMKFYQPEDFDRVLRLNLLGFLKPPQHMNLVTSQAVVESSKFLKENKKEFKKAQSKYQVPSDVIAALLWVETRHGDNLGEFHILSVFMDLLQTDRSVNRKQLTALALEVNGKSGEFTTPELKRIMKERTKNKSNWARQELKALAQIYQEKQLNLKSLKGSYAGAFGMTQFLPSSYRDYAKASRPKTSPDLMKTGDAIMSVAHYLHRHGWKPRKKVSSAKVLMSYNNSRDYAESILEISRRVSKPKPSVPSRVPTTLPEKANPKS